MTLSEFITTISQDILRDQSHRIWSISNLTRQINQAYETVQSDLIGFLPQSQKSASISLISGTTEYTLPSDYLSMESIRIDNGDELWLISKSETTDQLGLPDSYYIYGGSIGLYPTTTETGTAELLYNAKLPDLSDTQDTQTPKELDTAIQYLTASLCFKQVAKFDNAQLRESEYYKQINRAKVLLFDSSNFQYMPNVKY